MDGDIDYSQCTLAELREVESSINPRLYPVNYANLKAAIEKRLAESPESGTITAEDSIADTWETTHGPEVHQDIPSKELIKSVTIFTLAVFTQAILIPVALAEYGVPAGRWIRIIIYANAGMLVAHRFAKQHGRLYYFNELTGLMVACYCTVILIEIIFSIFFLPYLVDTPLVTGLVAVTVTIALLLILAFDAFLFFIAFQFPVRWYMRWTVRRLNSGSE